MFKALSKWLEAKDQAARQEQYDNGYGYAATRLMVYGDSPHDAEFDVTIFDRGVRDAVRDISNLKHQDKKLYHVERENKDLREIVRKMQTELQQLLEQIPMQALGDAKLPFKIEELPEWANWVAQDACGVWYCYEKKPIAYDSEVFDTPAVGEAGEYEFIVNGQPNASWRDTLQRITPEVSTDLPFKIEDFPSRTKWNWAAQDSDGKWYVYEKKPHVPGLSVAWVENSLDGDAELVHKGEPSLNWKSTLTCLT